VVGKINPYATVLTGEADASAGGGDIYLHEVVATRRIPMTSDPRVEIQQAPAAVAEELQIAAGSTVVSRHQQRLVDGIPFSLQTSFYPMILIERGAIDLIQAGDITQGAVAYLRDKLGVSQVGYRDKIMVRPPDANETAFFKLPDNGRVAVFEVLRTAFDQACRPFRLTVSVYPADRNEFIVNVGQVPDELEWSGTPADQQGEHGA
jgi:GntR family transcriptional regulator